MTLIAVWRDEYTLHIASDSRASLGREAGYTDTSVKIMPFTLRVFPPTPADASQATVPRMPVVQRCLGVSAAGATAATAPLKETLRVLLENVSAVPGFDPSMPNVARMAAHFLHTIWYRAQNTLKVDIDGRVLVLGFCPEQSRARAFSLRTNRQATPPAVDIEEVATTVGDVQFFGSGAAAAEKLRVATPPLSAAEIVRAVALDEDPDPDIHGVGGRVQYGAVEGTEFRVYPVMHYDFDEERRRARQGIFLGGVEIQAQGPPPGVARHASLAPPLPEGFALTVKAKDPFYSDYLRLIGGGYDVQPSYLFEERIE